MQVIMGFVVGSITALFFMSFGMFLQRKIDGTDKEEEE